MQTIYSHPKNKYVWNFDALNLSYFEIPKTGSSSTKTVLFKLNFGLSLEDELNIGGGKLANRFPDARATQFEAEHFLNRILIIYRDPIARAKSAYRSIFLGRQKETGPMSTYLRDYLPTYLASDPADGMLNHHKPMSWFFPQALRDDPRTLFIETSNLNGLPELLGIDISAVSKRGSDMPHMLNVNKKFGTVDLEDDEIRAELGPDFADDFALFGKLSATA